MLRNEEKRRAARIQFRLSDMLPVHYKFVSSQPEAQCEDVFTGGILNLSQGGALFVGTLPAGDAQGWLERLRQGVVLIGMNISLGAASGAGDQTPVKVLASLRWTRPAPAKVDALGDVGARDLGEGAYEVGVQFEQLDPSNRARLERFLASHPATTRKLTRPPSDAELN